MALMNGARLGIMSQAVGLSEAAYQEAYAYAIERKQFGQTIDNFPAVYEMLSIMRAKTDASRAHLYETCRFVDMYKTLEERAQTHPRRTQGTQILYPSSRCLYSHR